MPLIQVTTSIPANGRVDNVITGSQFEFLPFDAALAFGLVAAATGLLLDVYSGQDTLAEAMAPSIANRIPVYPDDFNLTDVAAGGERIKVRAVNTTGAAIVLNTSIRIDRL